MFDYAGSARLDSRVAIVTGAARGLGEEISEALLQAGAHVVLTDVLEDLGAETARRMGARHGGRASFRRLDVTREADWEAVTAETIERFRRFDVLVNNAGIEITGLVADLELSAFRRIMEINVDGVFLGTKHAVRAMRPDGRAGEGGSIINISSAAGLIGAMGLSSYCASKGAVRLLTKATAVECARLGYGIRINSVHPAVIKTEMAGESFGCLVDIGLAPDVAAAESLFLSMHPMGFGQPKDVAAAVLFLAGPASGWMTGSELVVDGGFTAA
jgi:NAD(P)-dependent dehydrogenase (short-subunit alcohol dehydrogenase family)